MERDENSNSLETSRLIDSISSGGGEHDEQYRALA